MNLSDLLAKLAKAPLAQRLLLLGMLAGLVALGNYFLFFSELVDARAAAVQQQSADQKELELQRQNEEHDLAYRNEIQALEDQARKQQNVLPSKSEIPALIEQVNGQAQLAGLQITVFKPGDEAPQQSWIKIPVAMEVHGTYEQIAKFFNDLGQLPRIVNVENLSLDAPAEIEGRTLLHGTFTVVTYRLADRPQAPPPGPPPAVASGGASGSAAGGGR